MTSTEEGPRGGGGWRFQPFASFRERGYPWLWASSLSYGAAQSAQGFVIIWLVIEKLDVDYPRGLFAVTLAIPALLLGLPAGWLADRRDRRKLLMASHVAVALALLLSAILVAADVLSVGLVVVMGVLASAGLALGAPVRHALIPALVPRERILNANALNDVAIALGVGAGIPLAGVVVAGWGIEAAFVILAAMAAVGVLFLIPLRVPPREQAAHDDEAAAGPSTPTTMRGDIAEAFRFLWGTIELRMLFVLLLAAALAGPWHGLGSELADHLDISARRLAFLYLFPAGGILVSVAVLTSVPRVRNAGRWYGLTIIACALLAVAVWLSPVYGLTALLFGLFGLGLGFRSLISVVLVQSHTPITIMGRVMGIYLTLTAAAGLLAQPIARAGRALLEDGGWIVFAGIVLVGVVAWVLIRNPGLRRMPSHPEEPAEAAPPESGSGWRRSDPLG